MTRLPWLGEWATPDMVRSCLRPLFLQTLAELAPTVLQALRDDVLPIYQRSWQSPLMKLAPSSPGEKVDRAGNPAPAWSKKDRVPTSYRMIPYERDPAAGRVHFTEEEAMALHAEGHELLADLNEPTPARYYLYQPAARRQLSNDAPDLHRVHFDLLDCYPALADLRRALSAWGHRFHIYEEWILDASLDQLDTWDRHMHLAYPLCRWPRRQEEPLSPASLSAWPARFNEEIRQAARRGRGPREMEGPVALGWLALPAFAWFSPIGEEERRLTFEHAGWDPAMGQRASTRSRILGEFTRHFDAYLDRLEDRVSQGRDRWQRTPGFSALGQHMQWLVRYQCGPESRADIAKADNYSLEGVAGAVRELARLLDLKLRPPPRGRPPGPKGQAPRRRTKG